MHSDSGWHVTVIGNNICLRGPYLIQISLSLSGPEWEYVASLAISGTILQPPWGWSSERKKPDP